MKEKSATVTVYYDQRREKKDGTFPVKLTIYHNYKKKRYPLGIDLTPKDFERSYFAEKPRKDYKVTKDNILALESKAVKIIEKMDFFTFESFERKMFQHSNDKDNVLAYFREYIADLEKQDRIGTAYNYSAGLKSLVRYLKNKHSLSFRDVTPDFLRQYEKWMLNEGKQLTTVGIYLRALRAVFNLARERGDLANEVYPFGKRKYQIPGGANVKKALSRQDLKALFEFEPLNEYQAKAKDFFFFSYQCNGINCRDIANLKFKDIQDDKIIFHRNKTKNTTRTNLKPIVAFKNDIIDTIIQKHGNKPGNPETFVFKVYNESMNAEQRHRANLNFIRFLNQHLKTLAKAAGLTSNISTNYARHSYTTSAIRNGASMEYIQESLGHKNIATTMNYWGGFEEKAKKEIAEKLMEF